ncbi:MAG TPA: HD domain-containing protein [Armatimonadota bacterium]|nr:HD domain-containing protein [Armatimonadota bacterium]
MSPSRERLERQIQFILEIDRAKQIIRRSLLSDASRLENDAEHSWHFAMMAILLSEYARDTGLDLFKVVKMALVHDLVEIDAGDTYIYDTAGNQDKLDRERKAADRIFALLPPDQGRELRGVWEEFEARESPEARFAAAIDRLQPLLMNYATRGVQWQRHGVTGDRVMAINSQIADGAPTLWEYASELIQAAMRQGFLAPPEADSSPPAPSVDTGKASGAEDDEGDFAR